MRRAAPHGGCEACGAATIKPIKSKINNQPETKTKSKIEIAIMILLWGLLIYGLYDKFIA